MGISYAPKRVVSLQPSITSILDRLGMLERVVACTKYCLDVCPSLKENPKTIVADSWTAQSEQILAANPDLVIASVPYQLEAVAEILKTGIPFLGLAPHSLRDIYADISHLAAIMGEPGRGEELIAEMKRAIDDVARRSEAARQKSVGLRALVYCEEWGKPMIHSQGWVAELVEAAGGDFLGVPGKQTSPDAIASANPDVIFAAWCGAGDRVPLEKMVETRGWEEVKAVKNGRVYCVNDEFLNTPGPTLLNGLYAIAAALWPESFRPPSGLRRISTVPAQS